MSEIHGAVGSYVINALDAEELDEFEAHLAVCPTCANEVVEFCETAAQLSLLAAPTAPPPALRNSILTAIKDVRPLPPQAPAPQAEVAPRRALVSTQAAAPIDELALRRQRRRTRILTLAVAAVTVVALSLGGWVFSLQQARQSQVAASTLETQLLTAPDLKVYTTTTANGGNVSFRVSKTLDKAMFVGSGLPALDADHRYQLWTINGSTPVPDGLVEGGDQRTWLKNPVGDAAAVAVTIEPKSGSTTPTTPLQAGPIAL